MATTTCAFGPGRPGRGAARRRRRRRRGAPSASRATRTPRSPGRRARVSGRGRARSAARPRRGALDDRDRERERLARAGRRLRDTSTPASASGRTSDWMRKGWVKPRASSTEATASDAPSSRKDCCDIGLFDSFLDSVETRVTRIQEEREAHLRSRHSVDRCRHSSSGARGPPRGSLRGPVTVADDKAAVTCPAVDTVGNNDDLLDPGETLTCTATYTVTQADLDGGSVTNKATASADGTDSNLATTTVKAHRADDAGSRHRRSRRRRAARTPRAASRSPTPTS